MNFIRFIMSLFTRRNTIIHPILNLNEPPSLNNKIDALLYTFTEEKINNMVNEHNYYCSDKIRISPYWSIYDKAMYLIQNFEVDKKNFVYYDLFFLFIIRPKERPAIKALQVF